MKELQHVREGSACREADAIEGERRQPNMIDVGGEVTSWAVVTATSLEGGALGLDKSRLIWDTSESDLRCRTRRGTLKDGGGAKLEVVTTDCPSSMSGSSSCQLIFTFSVNRLRIVNKLESVPPVPTSFRS